MRILIYGAGVIGCLYATLFSEAGYNTTIYARGRRLDSLEKNGLKFVRKDKIYKADVKIISELKVQDCYDFIFLTVRENQLHTALRELRSINGGLDHHWEYLDVRWTCTIPAERPVRGGQK